MIARFVQDLRYAFRSFVRAPGFTALAIATVAVGVGANAAIFSVVNAVLLRPLPFPQSDDLMLIGETDQHAKVNHGNASAANFLDWRARSRSFTGMAAFKGGTATVASSDRPELVPSESVTANFFDVLGIKPAIGRTFLPSDEGRGAPRVAVISDGLWRRSFGGRADIIGHTARFNDEPHTIVGVLAPGVQYPVRTGVWLSPHWSVPDDALSTADPVLNRSHSYLVVMARLRPGTTRTAAQADMDSVAASLAHDYPADDQDVGAAVTALRDDIVGDVKPTVLLLFAAVSLLLLIAIANVSGLLIARATARHQEVAIRIAIGAARSRILAQLLTESLLLALAGGAVGILMAMWLIGPLLSLSPADLTVAGPVGVDRTVLLFGLAASMTAGLLFGLAPALHASRLDVHGDLKHGARGGGSVRQKRVRATLVVSEIALSLVLLVSAGLTVRSLVALQREPAGFTPDHVLTFSVGLPSVRYPTPARKAEFWQRALEAVRRVPGVDAAGATSRLPLLPGNSTRGLTIPGRPADRPASADYRSASPDYFRVMGIPLARGRTFDAADREGAPLVAVVSASAAQRFWPDRNPIGERFSIDKPEITIIGVVADVHSASLATPPQPTIYVPYGQDPWPSMVVTLRTTAAPATLASAVRDAIWSIDKEQPIGAMRTMDEQLANSLSRRRFSVTLLATFGIVAVGLAAIGLYGVLAFIVAQRRREIGVRMALGARPRDIVTEVVGHGLRLAGAGILAGTALAIATTRLMTSLLYGTSPTDIATFSSVAALLAAIAASASFIPARRASRVDPLIALRDE